MSEGFRRVYLKPPGLSDADAARLAEQLTAAVEWERRLSARSPHVLQPVGGLQRDDVSFFVQHEPARPLPVQTLFDAKASFADERTLLRAAAALLDALRVAHERDEGRAGVHGGLSPGVILEAENGALKIGDFGIAPAICAVLGADKYVQLALACDDGSQSSFRATGIWEVLSPDEYERDDRICGYIDPEKYGTQALASFEPGSDIISAGFILHLLAEHRHPYLDDMEDLRIVELAESMAARLYNGARRKALRESPDPAVQRWCELVAKMLARLPRDRPSAATMASSLAEVGVKPMGVEDVLARRVEQAAELAQRGEWAAVRELVGSIASSSDAPAQVAGQAKALLQQAQAHGLIAEAASLLDREDWNAAKTALQHFAGLGGIPADLTRTAAELRTRLEANLHVIDAITGTETTVKNATQSDPAQAVSLLDSLIAELDALPAGRDIGPSVSKRRSTLRDRLGKQRDDLRSKAEARAAEFAVVNEWFTRLRDAWAKERWSDAEELFAKPPAAAHWPKDIRAEAQRLEKLIPQVREVEVWIEHLHAAVELEDSRETEKLLAKKPSLGDWPASLRNALTELEQRAETTKRRAADAEAAATWIDVVAKAVAKEDWATAQATLLAKPHLQHWPTEVAKREAAFRADMGKQLAERERDRLTIESWLQSADRAAADHKWEEAIRLLEAPPLDAKRVPKEIGSDVKARKQQYAASRDEDRRHAAEKRTLAAKETAASLVRTVLEKDLRGLIAVEALHIACGDVTWDSPEAPKRGTVPLELSVTKAPGKADENRLAHAVPVELHGTGLRITDEGSIRAALAARLATILERAQKYQVSQLTAALRAGLFPSAEVSVRLDALADRIPANVALLGPSVPDGRLETTIAWNAAALTWTQADPAAFAQRAIEIAVHASRDRIKPALLDQSELLRRYESVLTVEWSPPPVPPDGEIPGSLQMDGRLLLTPKGAKEPQLLTPVPVAVTKAGQVSVPSGGQAETAFQKALLVAQEASRERLEQDVHAKAKATPGKPKVVALTKAIKNPVEKAEFEIRPRQGERAQFAGVWDRETFEFTMPEKTRRQVEEFLEKLPAPSGGVGKRAFVLSGAAAAVVLVVAASVFWPKNSNATRPGTDGPNKPDNQPVATTDNRTPSPEVDGGADQGKPSDPAAATDNGGEAKPPTEPVKQPDEPPPATKTVEPRTLDEAAAAVRAILASSTNLATHAAELVTTAGAEGRAVATVALPGLAEPELKVSLTLSADQPVLSRVDSQAVADGVGRVDALLAQAVETTQQAVERVFDNDLCTRFIDCNAVAFEFDNRDVPWNLDTEQRAWSATDFVVRAYLGRERVSLFDFAAVIEVSGGKTLVRRSTADRPMPIDDLVKSLQADVTADVLRKQKASLEQYKGLLAAQGLSVASAPDALTEPQARVDLHGTLAGLKDRTIVMPWDRARLVFNPPTWDTDLARAAEAVDALRNLTAAISADPRHWIRSITDAAVFESSDSSARDLVLAVPAPWDAALPLPVHSAPYGGRTRGSSPIQPPLYWPILLRYRELAGTTFSLSQPADVAGFAGAVGKDSTVTAENRNAVLKYFDVKPDRAHVLPLVTLDPSAAPRLSAADTLAANPSLELTAMVRMGVDSSSPANADLAEIDTAAIDHAVEALWQTRSPAPSVCSLSLVLDPTDTTKVALQWSGLGTTAAGFAAVAGELDVLDDLLAAHKARAALEAELEAKLGGAAANSVTLTAAEAMGILRKVWGIKGAPLPAENVTLDAFSLSQKDRIKSKFAPLKRSGEPTIYAEYVTGPRTTYAVVWSTRLKKRQGEAAIPEGPFLIRLGANSTLSGPTADTANLGGRLIDPVLALVPAAIKTVSATPFEKRLGVALALDPRLPVPAPADLKLSEKRSYLEAASVDTGPIEDDVPWSSLQELRASPRASDYALLVALSGAEEWRPADQAAQWAIEQLDAAASGR